MHRLFMRLDRDDGNADYNAYKTRVANLAVLRNNSSDGGYCREASADFAAAESNRRPLTAFVATRPLDVRLPYKACDGETRVAARDKVTTPVPQSHAHHIRRRLRKASRTV